MIKSSYGPWIDKLQIKFDKRGTFHRGHAVCHVCGDGFSSVGYTRLGAERTLLYCVLEHYIVHVTHFVDGDMTAEAFKELHKEALNA